MADTPRVTVPVEPTDEMIEAGRWAGCIGSSVAGLVYDAMLSAAPAPEGGAVEAMLQDMAAIGHAARMLTDEIGRIPEKGRDPVTINNLEYYASQIAEWSGRSALATREEAPAEAGERRVSSESELKRIVKDLITHRRAGDYDLMADDVANCLWPHLRAQPPAREDAQPGADAVEPIERAAAALKGHIEAIQVAKADGGSSSVITDCVNGLPEIVRWIESGVFSVEAAFEQYEETHPAPDALRAAVEALEKIKTGRASVTECSLIARQALAALQAEQGAK